MENSAYVRDARPDELEEVALVIARAFYNDPLMNWMGCVSQKIMLPQRTNMSTSSLSSLPKALEILFYFHHSLVLSTSMVQGRIIVVAQTVSEGREKTLAACLWLPPGARVDTPWIILRSKQYRTIFGTFSRLGGWGLTGLKRTAFVYEIRINNVQKDALKKRNADFDNAWHLMDVATDPDDEGKGYCSMLLRQSLKDIAEGAPVYIEATTPRSRDIYQHLGFEVTDSPIFGQKEVTIAGLPSAVNEDEALTGFPVWTMLKTVTP